jgi:MoxR-like ATPase
VAAALGPQHFRDKGETVNGPFAMHVFETKSTSAATDLFYRYDSLRRFQAAHTPGMSSDTRDYITFEALGRAIIESLPFAAVAGLVGDEQDFPGPRRAVVLIDEIDKAPRDFPNDLLNEIERNFFRIPEWTDPATGRLRTVEADQRLRPIVILTSNSEKNLPAPFLRRCVFHHIRFPGRDQKDRLTRIIQSRMRGADGLPLDDAGPAGVLVESARDFFYDVRDKLQLEKMPTSFELIQWIHILHTPKWFGDDVEAAHRTLFDLPLERLKDTLGVIAKTAGDRSEIEALLASQLKR